MFHSNWNLNNSMLIEVARGCSKLTTLVLKHCARVNDRTLAQLFTYCTQLAYLDIDTCDLITGKCLETGGTAALRRLYIQYCGKVRKRLVDKKKSNQN